MAEDRKLSATRALTPRAVDADTIDLEGRRHRLFGVGASEMSTEAGRLATERAKAFLEQPGVQTRTMGTGYFGRALSEAIGPDGENLNARLIEEGLAVPTDYTGAGNIYPEATRKHVRRFFSERPDAGKSTMGEATKRKDGPTYTPPPATLTQAAAAGAKSGTDSLQAGAYGFASSLANIIAPPEGQQPDDDSPIERIGRNMRNDFENGFIRNSIEASRYAVAKSLEELTTSEDTTFGDWARWAAFNVGVGTPSLALMAGSAGVGGLAGLAAGAGLRALGLAGARTLMKKGVERSVAKPLAKGVIDKLPKYGARMGAMLGSGVPQGGQIYEDVKNKYGIDSTMTAVTTAVVTGGLDVVGLEYVLRGLLPDPKKHLSPSIARNLGRMMVGSSARGIIAEAPVEALQEIVAITAEGIHDPDETVLQKLASEESRWRILEAAAAGAIFGGVFGGTGGALSYTAQGFPTKQKPGKTPPPAAETQPAPTEEGPAPESSAQPSDLPPQDAADAAPPPPDDAGGPPPAGVLYEDESGAPTVDPRNAPPPVGLTPTEEGRPAPVEAPEGVQAVLGQRKFQNRPQAVAYAKEVAGLYGDLVSVKQQGTSVEVTLRNQETSDAQEVRGDQGQPDSEGRADEGSQDTGGANLQQQQEEGRTPSDGQPQAQAEPKGEPLSVTVFTDADRKRGHKGKIEEVEVGHGDTKRTVKGRKVVPPEGVNADFVVAKEREGWQVVETTTGMRIGGAHKTMKGAVASASAEMGKVGAERINEAIAKNQPQAAETKPAETKPLTKQEEFKQRRAKVQAEQKANRDAEIAAVKQAGGTVRPMKGDARAVVSFADPRDLADYLASRGYDEQTINNILRGQSGPEYTAIAEHVLAKDVQPAPTKRAAAQQRQQQTKPAKGEKVFAGKPAADAYAKQFGGKVEPRGNKWAVVGAQAKPQRQQRKAAPNKQRAQAQQRVNSLSKNIKNIEKPIAQLKKSGANPERLAKLEADKAKMEAERADLLHQLRTDEKPSTQEAPESTGVDPRAAKQPPIQEAPEATGVDPRAAKQPTQEAPADTGTDPRAAQQPTQEKAPPKKPTGPVTIVGGLNTGADATREPGAPLAKNKKQQEAVDAALKAGEVIHVHDRDQGQWYRVQRTKGVLSVEEVTGPPQEIQEAQDARDPWDGIKPAAKGALEETHATARTYIASANRIISRLPDGKYKDRLRKALQNAINRMPADKAFTEKQIARELGRAIELETHRYVMEMLKQDPSALLGVTLVGLDAQFLEKSEQRVNRPTLYAELSKRFPPSRLRQIDVEGSLADSLKVNTDGRPSAWKFTVRKPQRTEYLLGRMVRQWAGLLGMTDVAKNMVVTFKSPAEGGSDSVFAGPYGQAWMDMNTIYINSGLLAQGPKGVHDLSLLRKVAAHEFGHFVHEKVVDAAIGGVIGVDAPFTVRINDLLTLIEQMDADYHKWAGNDKTGRKGQIAALIKRFKQIKDPKELLDFAAEIAELGTDLTLSRGLFIGDDFKHPLNAAKRKNKSAELSKRMLRIKNALDKGQTISKEDLEFVRDHVENKLKKTIIDYTLSRSEWYADNIGAWLVTEQEPKSILDRFFKTLVNILKRFFGKAQSKDATTDVPPPADSVRGFMNYLMEQQIKVPKSRLSHAETIDPADMLKLLTGPMVERWPATRQALAIVTGRTGQVVPPSAKQIKTANKIIAESLRELGVKGNDEIIGLQVFRALFMASTNDMIDSTKTSLEANDESLYDFGEVLVSDSFDGVTPVIENDRFMIPTGYKIGGIFSRTAEREGVEALMRGARRLREVTNQRLPMIYYSLMESLAPPPVTLTELKINEYAEKLYQSYQLNKRGLLRNPKAPHEINMPVHPLMYEAMRPSIKAQIAKFVADTNSWNAREQNGVAKLTLDDLFDPTGLQQLYLTFDSSMEGDNPAAWRFSLRTHRETKQVWVWHENQHRLHNQVMDVMIETATRYAKERIDSSNRKWYLDNTLQFVAPAREVFDPKTGEFKNIPPKRVDLAIRVLETFGRSLTPGQRRPGTKTKNPLNQERNVMTAIGELMAQGYVLAETREVDGEWVDQVKDGKFTHDLVIGFGLGRGVAHRLSTVANRVRGEFATAEEIRWLEAHRDRMIELVQTLKERTHDLHVRERRLNGLVQRAEGTKRYTKIKEQHDKAAAALNDAFEEVFDILYEEGTPYDAKVEAQVQELADKYIKDDALIQMRKRIEALEEQRKKNPDLAAERLTKFLAERNRIESKYEALKGRRDMIARLEDQANSAMQAKLQAYMQAKQDGVKGAKMAAIREAYEDARAIHHYALLRKIQSIDPSYITDDEIVAAVLGDALWQVPEVGTERTFIESPGHAALKEFKESVGNKVAKDIEAANQQMKSIVQSLNALTSWANEQGITMTELEERGQETLDVEAFRELMDHTTRVLHLERKMAGMNAINNAPEKIAEVSKELAQARKDRAKLFNKFTSTRKGKAVMDLREIDQLIELAQADYTTARIKAEAQLHAALAEANLGKDRRKAETEMVNKLRVPYELERLQAAYRELVRVGPPPPGLQAKIAQVVKQIETYKLLLKLNTNEITNFDTLNRFLRTRQGSLSALGAPFWEGRQAIDEEQVQTAALYDQITESEQFGTDMIDHMIPEDQGYENAMKFSTGKGLDPHTGMPLTLTQHVESSERDFGRISYQAEFLPENKAAREQWQETIASIYQISGLDRFGIDFDFGFHQSPGESSKVVISVERGNSPHKRRITAKVLIDPNLKGNNEVLLRDIAHEMAHVMKDVLLGVEENKQSAVWRKLQDGYKKYADGNPEALAFEEWFADRFADWIVDTTWRGRKPKNVMQKWLNGLVKTIRQMLGVVKGEKSDNDAMYDFLDTLAIITTHDMLPDKIYGNYRNGNDAVFDELYERIRRQDPANLNQSGTVTYFADGGRSGAIPVSAPEPLARNRVFGMLLNGTQFVWNETSAFVKEIYNNYIRWSNRWLWAQRNENGAFIKAFRAFGMMWANQPGHPRGDVNPETGQWEDNVMFVTVDGKTERIYLGDEAIDDAIVRERGKWIERRMDALLKGIPDDAQEEVLKHLQAETNLNDIASDKVRKHVADVRSYLQSFYKTYIAPMYESKSGAHGEVVYGIKEWENNYFPRVLDPKILMEKKDEFIADLTQKIGMSRERAEEFYNSYLGNDNVDVWYDPNRAFAPGNPSGKPRSQELAAYAHILEPYAAKDVSYVLQTYMHSMIKRVEYERRYGGVSYSEGGTPYWDQNIHFERIRKLAAKEGASDAQIKHFMGVREAYIGRYKEHIPPQLRRFFSLTQTVLNFLLLPFATLSSFVDLANPMIRANGTVTFSMGNLKEAFKAVKEKGDNRLWRLAQSHGLVVDNVMHSVLADRFDTSYMTPIYQRMNEKFFRIIGLHQWTAAMRIYSFQMAQDFIHEHATNRTENGDAYLKELGLTAEEVLKWFHDGKKVWEVDPNTTNDALSRKVTIALNRFVSESVFRPNASQRPLWASDPHWMLVWHLKQFGYSFWANLVHRLIDVAKTRPGALAKMVTFLPLLAVLPLAMVGMELRNLIQYGASDEVPYNHQRGVTGYMAELVERSGVLGPTQFLWDALEAQERGKLFILSLLGPAATMTERIAADPVSKSIPLLIPGVSAMPPVRHWMTEQLSYD